MVLGRKRCIGAHLHGRVIVAMGAALERKRRTSGAGRKGEESETGREKNVSLPITSIEERVLRERERQRCWRKEDKEEDFLLTRGFSPLCGGALRYTARTMHFSHTFSGFLSLPSIGCIYQSTNRECRRRGLDAVTMWPFSLFFSLFDKTDNLIPSSMIQLYCFIRRKIRCWSSIQM